MSHCFQVIADYWSNFRFQQGYVSLTHSFWVNPKLNTMKFGLKKLETSLYDRM